MNPLNKRASITRQQESVCKRLLNKLERKDKEIVILKISGNPAVGKTTFTEGFNEFACQNGFDSVTINLDWFLKDTTQHRYEKIKEASDDLEHEAAANSLHWFDYHKLNEFLDRILKTGGAQLKNAYDQRNGQLTFNSSVSFMNNGKRKILILEGTKIIHSEVSINSDFSLLLLANQNERLRRHLSRDFRKYRSLAEIRYKIQNMAPYLDAYFKKYGNRFDLAIDNTVFNHPILLNPEKLDPTMILHNHNDQKWQEGSRPVSYLA